MLAAICALVGICLIPYSDQAGALGASGTIDVHLIILVAAGMQELVYSSSAGNLDGAAELSLPPALKRIVDWVEQPHDILGLLAICGSMFALGGLRSDHATVPNFICVVSLCLILASLTLRVERVCLEVPLPRAAQGLVPMRAWRAAA